MSSRAPARELRGRPAGLVERQPIAPRLHRRGDQRGDRLLIDAHVGEPIGRRRGLAEAGRVDAHGLGQAHARVDELGLRAGHRRLDEGGARLGAEAVDAGRLTAADPLIDQPDQHLLALGRRLRQLEVLLRRDQADVGEERAVDLLGRDLTRPAPRAPRSVNSGRALLRRDAGAAAALAERHQQPERQAGREARREAGAAERRIERLVAEVVLFALEQQLHARRHAVAQRLVERGAQAEVAGELILRQRAEPLEREAGAGGDRFADLGEQADRFLRRFDAAQQDAFEAERTALIDGDQASVAQVEQDRVERILVQRAVAERAQVDAERLLEVGDDERELILVDAERRHFGPVEAVERDGVGGELEVEVERAARQRRVRVDEDVAQLQVGAGEAEVQLLHQRPVVLLLAAGSPAPPAAGCSRRPGANVNVVSKRPLASCSWARAVSVSCAASATRGWYFSTRSIGLRQRDLRARRLAGAERRRRRIGAMAPVTGGSGRRLGGRPWRRRGSVVGAAAASRARGPLRAGRRRRGRAAASPGRPRPRAPAPGSAPGPAQRRWALALIGRSPRPSAATPASAR